MPCSVPPRRIGPAIASTSGGRPAATSFCIELWKPSGAPLSVARIGSGATLAPSAAPTAQASLTHPSNHGPPTRVRANYPERSSRCRSRQREGRQKAELAPEHRDLVLANVAAQPGAVQVLA